MSTTYKTRQNIRVRPVYIINCHSKEIQSKLQFKCKYVIAIRLFCKQVL